MRRAQEPVGAARCCSSRDPALAYGYIAVGLRRARRPAGTTRTSRPTSTSSASIAQTGPSRCFADGDWDSDLLARLTDRLVPQRLRGRRHPLRGPPAAALLPAGRARPSPDLPTMPLNRQILALRLFSILLGAVAVVAAFVVGAEAAPRSAGRLPS